MIRSLIAASLIAAAAAGAALAAGQVELTDENTAQVRTVLEQQVYEVAKIKIEDGFYEAYARKDGEKFEVFLDADFAVVRTEKDD